MKPLASTLVASLLTITLPLGSSAQVSESRRQQEQQEIAKLAELTRQDHSTIFLVGMTGSGYVRDGTFHEIPLDCAWPRGEGECWGFSVSRDGSRIAYATSDKKTQMSEFFVRNLATSSDKHLGSFETRVPTTSSLAWSWDDKEVVSEGINRVFAVSMDGKQRLLGHVLQTIDGKPPGYNWSTRSLDWLHNKPELVISALVCIPRKTPGTCDQEPETLLLFPDDSHLLAMGGASAVSPSGDSVAFASSNTIEVIDADGSNRHKITALPSFLWVKAAVAGRIVWSPTGDRLWFHTIDDEGGNCDVYLVDVKSGTRERILKKTLLTIYAWRR